MTNSSTAATSVASSLPYHEPSILQILILSSFLILLNLVNSLLDRTLYCGLIGQVLIGILYGTPGAKLLPAFISSSFETAVTQLGYLGLILLIYHGGVSTSLSSLKTNLALSAGVAVTGVAVPMGFSFILGPMLGATGLQCFAAGAALCSTSLGTTFTVLSTSGLVRTRLGSVLSCAAMMDDVVGLVMVEIVSSLGGSGVGDGSIAPTTVLRPVLVSGAFAVVVPLVNRFVLRPVMGWLDEKEEEGKREQVFGILRTGEAALVVHSLLLVGLVTGAAYAGASVLLAAYLAGIMVCWWDAERELQQEGKMKARERTAAASYSAESQGGNSEGASQHRNLRSDHSGLVIYEHYSQTTVDRILKPFFFASIGFSIPITKMFSGSIVWRGIIYTILMLLGKLACGLWLVRLPGLPSATRQPLSFFSGRLGKLASAVRSLGRKKTSSTPCPPRQSSLPEQTRAVSSTQSMGEHELAPMSSNRERREENPQSTTQSVPGNYSATSQRLKKPTSLYPAGILSFAMVARGEIGFLISAVAESQGIFRTSSENGNAREQPSEIFLIITWAIVLCTIIGPLVVGLLVKRVKRLEKLRKEGHRKGKVEEQECQTMVSGGDGFVASEGQDTTVRVGVGAKGKGQEPAEHDHVLGVWGV